MCKNCVYYVIGQTCSKIVSICAFELYTIEELKDAIRVTADTVDEDDYCEHFIEIHK